MSSKPDNDTEELREQILTEFKQVLKTAPFDHTENCTNIVMRLIAQHDTAYREGLLEALPKDRGAPKEARNRLTTIGQVLKDTSQGYNKALADVRTLIATYGKDQPKETETI